VPLYFWQAIQRPLDRARAGGRVGAADEKPTAKPRGPLDPNEPFAPTATDLARVPMQPRLSPRHLGRHRARLHRAGQEDLDKLLTGFSSENAWDNFIGPQAKLVPSSIRVSQSSDVRMLAITASSCRFAQHSVPAMTVTAITQSAATWAARR
jgi:hypothetical protein